MAYVYYTTAFSKYTVLNVKFVRPNILWHQMIGEIRPPPHPHPLLGWMLVHHRDLLVSILYIWVDRGTARVRCLA